MLRHGDFACVILWRDGKLLLGLRSARKRTYPNCWDILGGYVEPGETIEQALARELVEEVGLTPVEFFKLAVFDEPDPARHGQARYHAYVVTGWTGGEPAMLGDEHVDMAWFEPSEAALLPALAMPEYRELFEMAAARMRQRA